MKGSFNVKTSLKKKISGVGTSTEINLQKVQSKNTQNSLSLNSSSTIKGDKLLQLKEKLQKQKQMMRKSGKRFKEVSTIEIQTLQLKPEKQSEKSQRIQSGKVSISSTTMTNNSNNNRISSGKGTINESSKKNLFLKKDSNKMIEFNATTQQGIVNLNQNQQKIQQNKLQYESKKQSINLMQLSRVLDLQKKPSVSKQKQKKQIQMKSSKLFQKQIKEQKKRNMEIQKFLAQIGLQSFTEHFINMGYDQIDTLIQINVEDLNHMMMRAHQQDILIKKIKKYKQENDIQQQKQRPLIDKPAFIKTNIGFRPKSAVTTEPSSPQNSRVKFEQNLSSISKSSKRLKTDISESTLMNKTSFFYSVGSKQWSLQSQIRRACSGCFKIIPSNQLCQVGECYYCQKCNKNSIDTSIHLNDSMVRFYKDQEWSGCEQTKINFKK